MTTTARTFFAERKRIVELAGKYRLPAIYSQKEFVDEGGLMSYGADYADLYRRAAVYVDKILKGAKPADLPVQQATKFEFVINLEGSETDRTDTLAGISRAGESGDQMTTVSSQRLAVTSKTGANPMFRSIVICLLLTVLLFTISPADAQQPAKIPRIGFLTGHLPFHHLGPHRGIPAGSARAWVRGGEKHCH